MSKTLYLECASGISGDMTAAALLDLGADEQALRAALDTIPDKGFKVDITRVKKAGIDCCDFNVVLEHDNHDHDMEYLHGHEHTHEHTHEHSHGHDHEHEHHHHHHAHRGLAEIKEIISKIQMTDGARALAERIFGIVADAEAKAHALPIDQVHFHEVGALDSIVDIVSVAVLADSLDIESVIIPKLCEGTGTVRCAHGILPIPVPATANIAAAYGLDLQITDVRGELVTPTGAAIAAALRTSDKLPDGFKILKTGMGAGKRNYERPSILRAMLIEPNDCADVIYKLECNIDDCGGESLGFASERLFEAGARDVFFTPVYMKKNRPAYLLSVICSEGDITKLERIIFRETTTIGIRRVKMERTVLSREIITVNTPYGEAQVKVCDIGGEKRYYPEYESAAEICRREKLSFSDIYDIILLSCGKI